MRRDYPSVEWDDRLKGDLDTLLRLAVREDLYPGGDLTSTALVPADAIGRADVVTREDGVLAGLRGTRTIFEAIDPRLRWKPIMADGLTVRAMDRVGQIEGPVRGLLSVERLMLNLLGRLSGIATETRAYVQAIAHTRARIYGTRKTTPGWRRLEKYAVRCGGGRSHRAGLYAAVLIKDNHLAWGDESGAFLPAEAVRRARAHVAEHAPTGRRTLIQVEVDTLDQFEEVLPSKPDVILLDNMTVEHLTEAVRLREKLGSKVALEASGGVSLATVAAIAESGVDRISVGAVTHSAPWLDVGLDWSR